MAEPTTAQLVAFLTDLTAFFEDAPEHVSDLLEAHFGTGVGTEPITAMLDIFITQLTSTADIETATGETP